MTIDDLIKEVADGTDPSELLEKEVQTPLYNMANTEAKHIASAITNLQKTFINKNHKKSKDLLLFILGRYENIIEYLWGTKSLNIRNSTDKAHKALFNLNVED